MSSFCAAGFYMSTINLNWADHNGKDVKMCAISVFCHGINEICALYGFYIAQKAKRADIMWKYVRHKKIYTETLIYI